MMKRVILFIVILFCAVQSKAQQNVFGHAWLKFMVSGKYWGIINNAGDTGIRYSADSNILHVTYLTLANPIAQSKVTGLSDSLNAKVNSVVKRSDSFFYRTPNGEYFIGLDNSGGTGSFVDSNTISNDSLYYWIAGTKHFVGMVNQGGTAAWGTITGTLSSQTDLQTALNAKVTGNGAITGATKTKITYDSKGLVTSGADATTADIAASTDKNYVTDAQLVVIGNTSGTNTGDQTDITGNSQSTYTTNITSDNSTNASEYVTWVQGNTGNMPQIVSTALRFNPSTGVLSSTGFNGALTGNASTATVLQTARAIYGNNFDGSAALTQIIASTYGGTGNGFTKFSGPATSEKTFTLPNASATILTDNALVTAAQGGTANGFFAVSGPATSTKTFTFPNASSTVLTDNAVVTGAQGGTGVANTGKTITISGNTTIGSSTNTVAFSTSGNTSVTLPTSGTLATLAGSETFTNKTLTTPVIASITNTGTITLPTVTSTLVGYVLTTTASSSTPTPTGDARDNRMTITALAAAPTFAAPSGTATDGNTLLIRIKDNGTARALTWNAIYRAGTVLALPTTTTISKTMYVQFVYNSADTKWDLIGLTDGI